MSSKNAKKRDAVDKYLDRKRKTLDTMELHMHVLIMDYKRDLQAIREENLNMAREIRILKNQAIYDTNQILVDVAIIGKMSGMTPDELDLFIQTIHESVQRDQRTEKALNQILALSDMFSKL